MADRMKRSTRLAITGIAACTAVALLGAVFLTALLNGPWELAAVCCVLFLALCGLGFWGLVAMDGISEMAVDDSDEEDGWQS